MSSSHSADTNEKKCTVIPSPDYKAIGGSRSLSKTLNKGEYFELKVRAESKWNASGILLDSNGKYDFQVVDTITPLKDASIPATPEGWIMDSEEVKSFDVFMKLFFAAAKFFRRAPNSEWFYLMGAVKGAEYKQFPIGSGISGQKVVDGEFCAFVNDLSSKYGNNTGSLLLKVTRTE
jgi:hypothetical protein